MQSCGIHFARLRIKLLLILSQYCILQLVITYMSGRRSLAAAIIDDTNAPIAKTRNVNDAFPLDIAELYVRVCHGVPLLL